MTISSDARKHGIIPLKKYSQNFIFDSTLCDKIVRASGVKQNEVVLEVGPGSAGLTRSILKCSPKLLTIVEIDSRCINLLNEIKHGCTNLNIIQKDALELDLSTISSVDEKITIISNLPYNIGTELIVRWLKQSYLISSMTLMLQKEVVDRIRAKSGIKSYSRLSVICQLVCDVEKVFDVSRKAFYPMPKVESSIIKLTPKQPYISLDLIQKLEEVTRLAFMQRRKMLKSSLKNVIMASDAEKLGIDLTKRAENLSPEQYMILANWLLTSVGSKNL